MAGTLLDKVALVTGGGSGIGRATSLIYAREGAKVVVSDINAQDGEETVTRIKNVGGQAKFVHADVSKASEVEAMVGHAVSTYGKLDCAFNNAGISTAVAGGVNKIHDYPEESWDKVIDINLKGVWLCMKYEIPHMLEQGGGAIVNTSSVFGLVGGASSSSYAASKFGVVGLTKTAALEYAQQGIRVNCVCPGLIQTPLVSNILENPERHSLFAAKHPIGRFGVPDEVAEAVAWLSSDASSFVTGHAMAIEGGWTAR